MSAGSLRGFADVEGLPLVRDEADVVIIGSGAAGATAARVLASAGLDVVVLEEGPHMPTQKLRSDMHAGFSTVWRDSGFQVAEGRAVTPILQGRCVGGTTAVNSAIIHRIPIGVYREWQESYDLAGFWSYSDFERVWDRLDDELAVGTAPEAVYGRNNALMEAAASKLGIPGNRIRRAVRGCRGSSHCVQGCPTARRQSMDNSYVPRAIADGARVYAECLATTLRTAGGRAVGVAGRFRGAAGGRKGPRLEVRARRAVVLAASAIQSPLFLLRNGIGRGSGRVGKRLQAHPGTAVMGVFDEPVRQWFGATQGYETTHYVGERMKLETIAMPLELGAVRLPGLGANLMRNLASYGHVATWGVQIRARALGRVQPRPFGRTRIQFDLRDDDVRTLKVGVRRLAEMMFVAGAREVLPGVHGLPERIDSLDGLAKLDALPDDPRLFHCIAAHLFGTAVMGRNPAQSVVAPDGQAHDVPGLYVADSSIFPTNLGVNPQHAIAATAWLIAERIAGGQLA